MWKEPTEEEARRALKEILSMNEEEFSRLVDRMVEGRRKRISPGR